MKSAWLVVCVAMLACGCSKHDDKQPPVTSNTVIPGPIPGPTCNISTWENDGNTQSPGFVYPYSDKVTVKPYDSIAYSWRYPNNPTSWIAYNPKDSPLISFTASGQVVTVTIYSQGLEWAIAGTKTTCN